MDQRIATIEQTLRIQDATGATHLQQLEENPEAGLQKDEEDFDIEYDADGNPIYRSIFDYL